MLNAPSCRAPAGARGAALIWASPADPTALVADAPTSTKHAVTKLSTAAITRPYFQEGNLLPSMLCLQRSDHPTGDLMHRQQRGFITSRTVREPIRP